MTATATPKPAKPKKPAKLFETTCDSKGNVTLNLSKSSAFALAKSRDICTALAKAAPTVAAQSKGIAEALTRLLGDCNGSQLTAQEVDSLDDDAA